MRCENRLNVRAVWVRTASMRTINGGPIAPYNSQRCCVAQPVTDLSVQISLHREPITARANMSHGLLITRPRACVEYSEKIPSACEGSHISSPKWMRRMRQALEVTGNILLETRFTFLRFFLSIRPFDFLHSIPPFDFLFQLPTRILQDHL